MIRAVLDTPVLVAGFLGPEYSPAHALIEAHREGEFELVISPHLLADLDGVLRREAFARQAAGSRGEQFVERLAAASLFVSELYDLPRLTADRHHDLLVAVAREGGTSYVVSSEQELLRSFVRGMTIVTPEEFLAGLDRVAQLIASAA